MHSSHPTRNDVVETARSFIGTPFVHQGRLPGVGLDCVGVLLAVADKLSISGVDFPGYDRTPDGTLEEKLSASLELANRRCIHCHMPGDVLCFRIANQPQHVAIRSDRGLIHSLADSKILQETSYDERWRKRLLSVWVWPELDDVELLPPAYPQNHYMNKEPDPRLRKKCCNG